MRETYIKVKYRDVSFHLKIVANPLLALYTNRLLRYILATRPIASGFSLLSNLCSMGQKIKFSAVYRGYSIFLLNMAFISSSEVKNIYIS